MKLLCQSVTDATISTSIQFVSVEWPTGHRPSPMRGRAMATVRRPWPHRSVHGAFKGATTHQRCPYSLSLPHSSSTRRN
jgi:hypothetical protein